MRLARRSRRRAVPYLMVGVLLVVGCGLVFLIGSLRASGRLPVLALARAVPAGHVLTDADLRTTQVAAGEDVGTVPVTERESLIGRTVAVPRPAGSLLIRDDVGPPAFPPSGQAVAAVALKPGQYPPSLTAGARVAVLAGSGPATAGSAGQRPSEVRRFIAAVVEVQPGGVDGQAGAVVSLLMTESDATALGAAGQVSLVLLAPGARGGGS